MPYEEKNISECIVAKNDTGTSFAFLCSLGIDFGLNYHLHSSTFFFPVYTAVIPIPFFGLAVAVLFFVLLFVPCTLTPGTRVVSGTLFAFLCSLGIWLWFDFHRSILYEYVLCSFSMLFLNSL